MKYAYAGDRAISVRILEFLISKGLKPAALMVSDEGKASHAAELIALSGLSEALIFRGNAFKTAEAVARLRELDLDYVFGIHFPYLVPKAILDLPKVGVLNLHPAYLPYNKGWHTPSWAILEGQPYGATLHFMEEALDQGDIIHQKKLDVLPTDTANSLYQRALTLEEEVFFEAFENLLTLNPKRKKQEGSGTVHFKKDLEEIQKIELARQYTGEELINKLRGLTTNTEQEAAYFEYQGKKIAIQVFFKEF
jgi:methionyl-tRNA formyltransferase